MEETKCKHKKILIPSIVCELYRMPMPLVSLVNMGKEKRVFQLVPFLYGEYVFSTCHLYAYIFYF